MHSYNYSDILNFNNYIKFDVLYVTFNIVSLKFKVLINNGTM